MLSTKLQTGMIYNKAFGERPKAKGNKGYPEGSEWNQIDSKWIQNESNLNQN